MIFLSALSQNIIHEYSSDKYVFDHSNDVLYVLNDHEVQAWNTTTTNLIDRANIILDNTLFWSIKVTVDYLYVTNWGSKCVNQFSVEDFSIAKEICFNEFINFFGLNDNFIYIGAFVTEELSFIRILEHETFREINKTGDIKMRNLEVSNDDFVVLSLASLTKYTKTGALVWQTKLNLINFKEYESMDQPTAYYSPPFLFVTQHNMLYQLNSEDGKPLREVSVSNYPIISIEVYQSLLFVYVASSEIFVISTQHMKLLNILSSQYVGHAFGTLKISGNFLFQSLLNISYSSNVCKTKWKVVQRKIDIGSTLHSDFKYTKGISSENSIIQIKHQPTPKTRLNFALITKRWNKLMGNMWAQNSFFSPILIPTSNDSGIFIYFSGAGSIERKMCERNQINYINISTFQDIDNAPKFDSQYYLVFDQIFNEFCCPYNVNMPDILYCYLNDQQTSIRHGSLFDYASVLVVNNEYLNVYLIHSGCHCYDTELSSHSFYVDFLQNNAYMKLEQNIDLRL